MTPPDATAATGPTVAARPTAAGTRTTAVGVADVRHDHIAAITAIYAHYVRDATCSFELEPPTADEMARRLAAVAAEGLPALVATDADGMVLGYAYAAPYRARPAYRHTVENSVYVAPGLGGRGIGRQLLDTLVSRCRAAGRTQIVAVIGDSANAGSIALHARAGFRHVGTLQHVGWKFGRWLDTVLMQHDLRAQPDPGAAVDPGAASGPNAASGQAPASGLPAEPALTTGR